MSLHIRTNLPSLRAQTNLNRSTDSLNGVYQRLSSGQRVNNAQDDPAGFAIATGLRAHSRIASIAVRNANDGISAISITDGAIGQISLILSRLDELAQQSANGIYTTTQRSAIQSEFTALLSEVERIANITEFNGVKLLSGNASVGFHIGFDGTSLSTVSYSGIPATLASMGLAPLGSSIQTYSLIAATNGESQVASRLALDAIKGAIESVTVHRGMLGAVQSRLEKTISSLETARENMTTAAGGIVDADVATEAAELTRLNILQQAGTAILAQANQQPSLVLPLLRG